MIQCIKKNGIKQAGFLVKKFRDLDWGVGVLMLRWFVSGFPGWVD